jgi:hypothetical protein
MRASDLGELDRWRARSTLGAPAGIELRGADLVLHTVVGGHELVLERD